jgi:hypothetical protein
MQTVQTLRLAEELLWSLSQRVDQMLRYCQMHSLPQELPQTHSARKHLQLPVSQIRFVQIRCYLWKPVHQMHCCSRTLMAPTEQRDRQKLKLSFLQPRTCRTHQTLMSAEADRTLMLQVKRFQTHSWWMQILRMQIPPSRMHLTAPQGFWRESRSSVELLERD